MKRVQTVIGCSATVSPRVLACVCGFVTALALSPALATSSGPAYEVTAIGPPGPESNSYSIGINARGDVVGETGTTTQVPFLYRQGRFARLTPPAGVSDAQATGINDADVVSVQSIAANGDSAAFAVKPEGTGFAWIPLQTGSLHCENLSVANVAGNGDIDGGLTLILPSGDLQQRAVIWRVGCNGTYEPAQLLPMTSGFVATMAGGIWSRNGRSYVAGAQGDRGSFPFQQVGLWSPRPTLTYTPNQMPFASTIGGAANDVYAAGTSRSNSFYAWVGKVTFDRTGVASLQSVDFLPMYPGYDQAIGAGVMVDSQGRPIVVGDVTSSTDFNTRGAVWVGDNSPRLLQSLVGSSPWTISAAGGINSKGEIAAIGTMDGTEDALLLRPRN